MLCEITNIDNLATCTGQLRCILSCYRDKSVCTDRTVIVHGPVLLYPVMLPPRLRTVGMTSLLLKDPFDQVHHHIPCLRPGLLQVLGTGRSLRIARRPSKSNDPLECLIW